jgi:hypothetical protein
VTPRQFADLAAAIALHSDDLPAACAPDAVKLHRVWKRAIECFANWRKELLRNPSPSLYAEVFAAELPIRVWCGAVADGRDQTGGRGAAVAANINRELLALRCVILQALAADAGLSPSEAAAVDRFRRRCERWCDVLVGPIAARTGAAESAFRPDRALEFGQRLKTEPSGRAAWQLVIAGLRIAFAEADSYRGAREDRDVNRAVDLASALVTSFPRGAFASSGTLRDPYLGRLTRVANETAPRKISAKKPKAASAPPMVHEPLSSPPPAHHESPAISFSRLRKRSPKQ